MWAVGVIMYELFKYLGMDSAEKKKKEYSKNHFQAFKGKHCFPLSPNGLVWDTDGLPDTRDDLLDAIFDLIGTPDE